MTQRAIAIAKLARQDVISAQLSRTQFHTKYKIDQSVEFEFMKLPDSIVKTIRVPIKSGRCNEGAETCTCPRVFVKPNGDIYQCGCKDSPKIGNVFNKNLELNFTNQCHTKGE